eukprot:3934014-Lingulodinium_polyedra.AAC.1
MPQRGRAPPTMSRNVRDTSIVSCARGARRSCRRDPRVWDDRGTWDRWPRSISQKIGSRGNAY